MRTQRIREEKPRPKRRRRDLDDLAEAPAARELGAISRARDLLGRLHAECDAIDEMLRPV
jgi:hypothetical protein